MRVLILTDESFAGRERSLLARLEVGLADDGVRIVHGIPRKAIRWQQTGVFSHEITYEAKGFSVSRPWRVRQVLRTLEDLAGSDGRPVDLIHCFGEESWSFGIELAALTGAGLAIELWRPDLAAHLARFRHGEIQAPIFFIPDTALERTFRAQDPNLSIRSTPWGIHTPPQPLDILTTDKTASIMVAGSGLDPAAMKVALEGLAAAAARHPNLMIFADASAINTAQAWPTVRRLGLLDRFTLIPDMEARRELALRGDILLLPEARGEQRSLTLDAMGHGMLILAAADPLNSTLIDTRTARLIDKPAADAWAAAISWALEDRPHAITLAQSGREFVRQNRKASAYVASVVDAYEWMSAGDAIPFGAAV